jgi:hypothetical protein
LRDFNDRNIRSPIENSRYLLITREMSLGKLKEEDVSRFQIYTMRDSVVDGETAISDNSADVQKQDVHAKVYMMRKYSDTDLYLGSLNASHNAIHGNVEFMLKLRAKNRYLNMDKMISDLFGSEKDGSDNPFQEVTLQNAIIDEEDAKKKELDGLIKAINRAKPHAEVYQQADNSYAATVHFGEIDTKGYSVEVRPMLSKKTCELSANVCFEGLQLVQLSEFYSITVRDGDQSSERILIIPTDGLPSDREKAVVSSVVSDKACFYRYIAFLLGDDSILGALEGSVVEGTNAGADNRGSYNIPALYEKMLQTAAANPEKFKGIEYLMKTISDDGIIPDEFKKLYETFKKAVKIRG